MTAAAICVMDKTYTFMGNDSARSDDKKLMARCRAGDTSAFNEIYTVNRMKVFLTVARMVNNEADRDEITQEVFFQVFRSLKKYKGTAKLSTWIHRIAINVILQYIRKKKSRIKIQLEEDITTKITAELSKANTPEEDLSQSQRKEAVKRALELLSPKKRVALVLHDFEGLKATEVAEVVGASVLTVRTRIFYARKEFYARLMKEPIFGELNLEKEVRS
jgi:RNA polymerase sigma-70 factor (ECF subfamily)